jgi:hypothetical protein
MKPRAPQLALRLDAAPPDTQTPWCAGGQVAYLGVCLTLVPDSELHTPQRVGNELHLPLPPGATPRQIRDAAESWLRDEGLALFTRIAAEKSALAGRQGFVAPPVALAFGKGGDWVRIEEGRLRCHWRLIEQPEAVIAQVLANALAKMQQAQACDDLFALT